MSLHVISAALLKALHIQIIIIIIIIIIHTGDISLVKFVTADICTLVELNIAEIKQKHTNIMDHKLTIKHPDLHDTFTVTQCNN